MRQAHAPRDTRVPGMGLAQNGGKAPELGNRSAVGLFSQHR